MTNAPAVQCPRCDRMTDEVEGHEVVDGRVTKCPFINVDISFIKQGKPRDRSQEK